MFVFRLQGDPRVQLVVAAAAANAANAAVAATTNFCILLEGRRGGDTLLTRST